MINESKDRPKGPLRVTTTVAFGSTWLTPRINEFLALYPEISMTLLVDDSELDLATGRADVAIRFVPPRQPDLVQRQLTTVHIHAYASPEYLARYGTPQAPEDLDDHRLIIYGTDVRPPVPNINWLLEAGARPGVKRRPILNVNNIYGMYRAVQTGVGIAALPDYMAHEDQNLVRVLAELEGQTINAYFVYPEELRHSKRVTVFRDFLIQRIAESHF
jgi:DNA-binding transcriptional LysR family regulator